MPLLSPEKLSQAAARHHQRMTLLLSGYRDRQHPIFNFLFGYFFFRPKSLFKYTPGLAASLLLERNQSMPDFDFADLLQPEDSFSNRYKLLPPTGYYTAKQRKKFSETMQMLKKVELRPPLLHCYGLHEWAMLYRLNPDKKVKLSKFQNLPLRVTPEEISHVLHTKTLRCTHYDAFRFFTQDAIPLNVVSPAPSRESVGDNDQAGCLHVNMDLFKWSLKIFPFCSSELLYEALDLAIAAREIDMRASPYDLTAYQQQKNSRVFDPEPIKIETSDGRREYKKHQELLYRRSIPIRKTLISTYEILLKQIAAREAEGYCKFENIMN